MIYRTVDIKNTNSEEYAHLDVYALDASEEMPSSKLRPAVIICPGGAYAWTSKREGEPVAMKLLSEGIHAAVLWYSTKPAVFPTALLEVAASIKYLRENAQELHIDMNNISVMGFSAGGHLAASYGCFWNREFVREALKLSEAKAGWLKPNGLILCYPVITAGDKTHEESIENISGGDKELRSRLSLEEQVSADTPRTFIWHTQPDGVVPVENTLLFINALQKQGISYEAHIYPEGGHGLSLANELTLTSWGTENVPCVQPWITDACRWIRK